MALPTLPRSLAIALAAVLLVVGAFLLGRATASDPGFAAGHAEGVQEGRALQQPAGSREAFAAGYAAGANDVFGGYDGGWSFGRPYVITLGRGSGGVTYRIASRR